MKKTVLILCGVTLFLFIISLFFFKIDHNKIITVTDVDLNNRKVILSGNTNFKFEFEEITYKGIDYISLDDTTKFIELANPIFKGLIINNDESELKKNMFLLKQNSIYVKNRYIGEGEGILELNGLLKIQREFDMKPTEEIFKLDDFGVSYIQYNNEYYFPTMLLNLTVLNFQANLFKTNDKNYYLINSMEYKDPILQKHINDIELKFELMSNELNYFTAKYLEYFLYNYYPYYVERKEVIDNNLSSMFENINDNKPYYYFVFYVRKVISDLGDMHTRLLPSKDFEDGQLMNDLNNDSNAIEIKKSIQNYFGYRVNTEEDFYEYFNHKNSINNFINTQYEDFEEESIAYCHVETMEDQSVYNEFVNRTKKANNIILDLRCNQGGSFYSACLYLEKLLSKEFNLNFEQLRNGKLYSNLSAKITPNNLDSKKIIILTNKYTYSAGNVLASLLKDCGAIIIGERSLGGGSPIIFTTLPNGMMITASSPHIIFLNSKKERIEFGVEPDIIVEENISNGKDAIMEKALMYINESE